MLCISRQESKSDTSGDENAAEDTVSTSDISRQQVMDNYLTQLSH